MTRFSWRWDWAAPAIVILSSAARAGTLPNTTFTYQGQLKQNGVPASGEFDLRFRLIRSPINSIELCVDNVPVVNGLFSASLDFGTLLFNGSELDLEVALRPGGPPADCFLFPGPDYTTLVPRQPVTPVPYALHASSTPAPSTLANPDNARDTVVTVDSDGEVGIGTEIPLTNLHVVDGTGVSGSIHPDSIAAFQRDGSAFLYVETSESGVGGVAFGHPGKSQAAGIVFGDAATSEGLQFQTGGLARMAISSAGRVGIGVTAPTDRLHLGGTPGTDGIRFPDGTQQTTAYRRLKASAVFDPPSVAAGASTTVSIAVVGAAVGDVAIFNPRVGMPAGLIVAQTRVNTDGVVVTLYNASAIIIDAPGNTADVVVLK